MNTTDTVRVVLDATKGHRVDNRFAVACNVVGALREAGLLPYPTTDNPACPMCKGTGVALTVNEDHGLNMCGIPEDGHTLRLDCVETHCRGCEDHQPSDL